ncbi:hypothetical protein QEH52_15165 [Coraliomargarita sp. SDUM461003]|uniref:Sortilin N-terminal domain-containing protein n=1 Tax=Thalassobacterium maritimum TaxID=3041265 RepID=A0ABU1AXQ5_9BACT|nr:hypothetical protein [Coraliomargarita sp. SDUM461003]MDQ8208866.1 hypothetical protein [Coraliomargarita sp. SDUM461003]
MKFPSMRFARRLLGLLLTSLWITASAAAETPTVDAKWQQTGWGGGGYFYAAAFHPSKPGLIYLAGDVAGVYKTEDYGRNWRMINNGLANYGVFSLAVDSSNPDTVYAATESGLCKSMDAGETWQLLPQTGPKELAILGKKKKSIRSVAVDPRDGNVIYAGTPFGKVFRSRDGGQSWQEIYKVAVAGAEEGRLRLQYGKADGNYFGGMWTQLSFPEHVNPADAVGFGMNFKGDGSKPPKGFYIYLKGSGFTYQSRNLNELFAVEEARDVILTAEDFSIDPTFAKQHPDKAAALAATPDWSKVNRIDVSCVGDLPRQQHVASISSFFIAATQSSDGQVGSREQPVLVPIKVLSNKSRPSKYGNLRIGDPVAGAVHTVAVSPLDPKRLIAATDGNGLVLSSDQGASWVKLDTPQKASGVAFDPLQANVVYGTFFSDGLWKSNDFGKTWKRLKNGMAYKVSLLEVAVSPADSNDVYAVGSQGWNGAFYRSTDGGNTWIDSSYTKPDYAANPTLPETGELSRMSVVTNITINPLNPQQLYTSANWRCSLSEDGGKTWEERIQMADISCVTDIQFIGDRTYVTAMDEGTLMSPDNGKSWKQLWPLKYQGNLSGHNWRVRVNHIDGQDRIISTASPWDGSKPQLIVVSEDGGESYQTTTDGLPDYRISANTMWGRGYPRALAVDPSNPQVVYLGIDGDATKGKSGGGIFKSVDGGHTWQQLANQPGSRRMYYGLTIDPTNPQRIYWAGFGSKGGVYRSEDGGDSWQRVFSKDQYLFNLMTTADGTVYAGGKELYRSTDHGKTWKTVTKFNNKRSIVGIEVHPEDPNTLWISEVVWSNDASGGIYKTTDGGATWVDMTGDIPYRRPQVLRFNPETSELWAGYVGLYKIKQ